MSSVGRAVVALREGHGWTQTALAGKANMRAAVLARIESGEEPTTANLMRLARALSVSPERLRGHDGAVGLEAEPSYRALMARLDSLYEHSPAKARKILTIFNQSFVLAENKKTPAD